MRGVAQRQHAGTQFLRAQDGAADGIGGHARTVAAAGVDHQQRAGIQHGHRRLVRHQQPIVQQFDIARQHADTMAVMPGQIGPHQMIGDLGRFRLLAAHAAGDQLGHGLQGMRRQRGHRDTSGRKTGSLARSAARRLQPGQEGQRDVQQSSRFC